MKENAVACDVSRITTLAKERGCTMAHLCKLCGKPRSYLADVRNEKTRLSVDDLNIIASALDTTPEYLAGTSDNSSRATPLSRQVQDALNGLTDEQIGIVLAFIAGLKA